nr:MAG TPA: hypothetical protein [Caudoviricetes sp.]
MNLYDEILTRLYFCYNHKFHNDSQKYLIILISFVKLLYIDYVMCLYYS